MSDERSEYPAGVPCWIDTSQADPEAAVEFYGGLFGWEFADRTPAGSPQRYFLARLRGRDIAGIGSLPQGWSEPAAWNTHVAVENADDAAAKVTEAGGTVTMAPLDASDAGRMAVVADPSGAGFCLWQAGASPGAVLVNEPGTWNFSHLNTRDPKGAIDFYGKVFGWELARDPSAGDGDTGFWRRPGYADFLERDNPELRTRMKEVGAPEGFEDAVAWLVPMTDDQFQAETPPHWGITIAVDDADATAKRAEELGGTIVSEPIDAPWVRMTILRDPQGAVFTASKFVPPTTDN